MLQYSIDKKRQVMKKIDHKLFINTLKERGITQKAFANYAKISYDTVTGWKKKGKVPAYAMVIARDMAYRMKLDEHIKKQLQRKKKRDFIKVDGLHPSEQKHIEALFWGTNLTAGEIIEDAQKGDTSTIKSLKENLPKSLYSKISDIKVKHYD